MPVINTVALLQDIQKGQEQAAKTQDENLQNLVNSAVSILALCLRASSAVVSDPQKDVVVRLHDWLSTR